MPVSKEIQKLFDKKKEQGVKPLKDSEIEAMIEAMNALIQNPKTPATELADAKTQVAILEGIKAERAKWHEIKSTPKGFPAIKAPAKQPWWKAFI